MTSGMITHRVLEEGEVIMEESGEYKDDDTNMEDFFGDDDDEVESHTDFNQDDDDDANFLMALASGRDDDDGVGVSGVQDGSVGGDEEGGTPYNFWDNWFGSSGSATQPVDEQEYEQQESGDDAFLGSGEAEEEEEEGDDQFMFDDDDKVFSGGSEGDEEEEEDLEGANQWPILQSHLTTREQEHVMTTVEPEQHAAVVQEEAESNWYPFQNQVPDPPPASTYPKQVVRGASGLEEGDGSGFGTFLGMIFLGGIMASIMMRRKPKGAAVSKRHEQYHKLT